MWEYLLVGAIVLVATIFSAKKIRQSSQGSCSGCQQCPSARQSNKKTVCSSVARKA